MKKILILSDTHGYSGNEILIRAQQADEIWHAGDIGSVDVLEQLQSLSTVRAVYGNIDSYIIRKQIAEVSIFEIEGIKVLITHICGYPGNYASGIQRLINENKPQIVVGGHSHILKVMRDAKNNLLYINPGAIGKSGFHAVRTMIMMDIDNGKPQNLEVIEYSRG